MQSNDLYDEYTLLLNWVNREQLQLSDEEIYESVQEVIKSFFMSQMLLKIDSVYFAGLRNKLRPKEGYFQIIKDYMQKIEGKRLRRSFRLKMEQQQPLIGSIKLLLFLCVKSSIKQECVSRILELSEETQTYLMGQLQKIDDNIDSINDITDFLRKIEESEQQNDQLKQKLKDLQDQYHKTEIAFHESKQNQRILSQECKKYEQEKVKILSEIGIRDIKDYTELLKDMKAQFKQMVFNYEQIQKKNKILQKNNQQFLGKAAKDSLMISNLNDEIKQYKTVCYDMKEQISLLSQSCKDNTQHILRQKTQFHNNKIRNSFQTNISFSSFLNCLEDDDYQNQMIRIHNNQVMNRLEMTYKKITQLTSDITQLKQQNYTLKKINQSNMIKLNKLKQLHKIFSEEYDNLYH